MTHVPYNAYKNLCAQYYEITKPHAPPEALAWYLQYAAQAHGPILEPMCGTGRFLIPLAKHGYNVTGFDISPYMLKICRAKVQQERLFCNIIEASFETFSSPLSYNLIYIPSGSFSLLTERSQVHQALQLMTRQLASNGRLVLEIETPHARTLHPHAWQATWCYTQEGDKIIHNFVAHYNANTQIQTSLHRYELWSGNAIIHTEIEELNLRLYAPVEIERILHEYGLSIIDKRIPYINNRELHPESDTLLYECVKK